MYFVELVCGVSSLIDHMRPKKGQHVIMTFQLHEMDLEVGSQVFALRDEAMSGPCF